MLNISTPGGVILVYSVLFGVGKILRMQTGEGLTFLDAAGAAACMIWRDLGNSV